MDPFRIEVDGPARPNSSPTANPTTPTIKRRPSERPILEPKASALVPIKDGRPMAALSGTPHLQKSVFPVTVKLNYFSLYAVHAPFKYLTEQQRLEVLSTAEMRSFTRDQALLHQDSVCDGVYVLIGGSVYIKDGEKVFS
jgi:hypothetical protein